MLVSSQPTEMPTVLRVQGYRLFFYAGDGIEPPHVHVESGDGEAKVWLQSVSVANTVGYSQREAQRILRLVEEHQTELLKAWYDFFTS